VYKPLKPVDRSCAVVNGEGAVAVERVHQTSCASAVDVIKTVIPREEHALISAETDGVGIVRECTRGGRKLVAHCGHAAEPNAGRDISWIYYFYF